MFLFKFPDVGEGIQEGTVVRVIVKEGQAVKGDEPMFEVETDKAVVELPAPQTGIILKVYVHQGDVIKVGQTIIAIGTQGEKAPEKPDEGPAQAPHVEKPISPGEKDKPLVTAVPSAGGKTEVHVLATPAVRALAQKLGVDLEKVSGTGPSGRIMPDDVEKASKAPKQTTTTTPAPASAKEMTFDGPVDIKPLTTMCRAITDRMTKWLSIPQAGVSEDIDMTRLYELRERMKKEKPDLKLTYLAFIVKAIAKTLEKHPMLNASFISEAQGIAYKKYYSIGIATDTDHGLVVPVVKKADEKKISEIAREIETLASTARERKIHLDDLRGGTFTITNVGSLGGVATAPVINFPESGIMALNKMRDTPAVFEGKITSRKIMRVDLGFDHRILDGADAVRFLIDFKELMENPEKLMDYF